MDEVEVVRYDPAWIAMYELEADSIRVALGDRFSYVLEHFGSTAVPGLSAKPIIDIMLGTNSKEDWPDLIAPLETLGYDYWSENPNKERMFFVKGLPPKARRTHHIHVFEIGSIYWDRLMFRDFLRQNPDDALEYMALKEELALKFKQDRDAYTHGKEEFVRRIMGKAGGRYSPSN
jgi:GrpB-like predicted nucleotidyltransferase (UPF0157 family)